MTNNSMSIDTPVLKNLFIFKNIGYMSRVYSCRIDDKGEERSIDFIKQIRYSTLGNSLVL